MTVCISLQLNGRVNCQLLACILFAFLQARCFLSRQPGQYQLCFIAQWIDGAGQAVCSLLLYGASPCNLTSADVEKPPWGELLLNDRNSHLYLAVWCLSEAEPHAKEVGPSYSAATDISCFLLAFWELGKPSMPHWFPARQLESSLHSSPFLLAFMAPTWAVLGDI